MLGLLLGMKPVKLELMPFGVSVSFKLCIKDYNKKIFRANLLELKKIIIATCGPATNLLLIVILKTFDINIITKNVAIYSNFLIMLFNMLPIYPLDGGRILKSIVHIIFGGKTAKIVTNKIANIFIVIITIIGSIGIFYYENISIFLIIIFLWYLVINENKKYKLFLRVYDRGEFFE